MRDVKISLDHQFLTFTVKTVLLLTIVTALNLAAIGGANDRSFGANDFSEYWSAYQLYSHNQDPYDKEAMLEIQRDLGFSRDSALMMYNPPWLLTLMSPLLNLDFPLATKVWLLTNIVLTALSILLIWHAVSGKKESLFSAFLGGLTFYPLFNTAQIGQSSILITFGLALILWGLEKKKNTLVGLSLILLTIKPHLPYLFLLALGWWIIVHKKFSIVASFLIGFAALLALTFLQSNAALGFWVESLKTPPVHFKSSTLSGILIAMLPNYIDSFRDAVFVTSVIPCTSLLALYVYLLRERPKIQWASFMPPLLSLSLFTSPYGWLFDQSCLVMIPISTLCATYKSKLRNRYFITVVLCITSFLLLPNTILLFCAEAYYHYFFWLPLACLLAWKVAGATSPISKNGLTPFQTLSLRALK
ncbi:MAG: DUF2029 domain-containing protein [Deltaproteobacteria bacterium]|nr:DUF2029 domain-containing protein [Deltaproteobacteria bacterium]